MKTLTLSAILLGITLASPSLAENPADLNDLQIAHVAYIADNIDIRYAHLALAMTSNKEVRGFAETMIRDHEAVNQAALDLLAKLGASPEDNFLSQSLNEGAEVIIDKLSALRGSEFDLVYAENELAYHKAVNGLIGDAFIPNIENAEVKALFEQGHKIFLRHEQHAVDMVKALK